MRIIIFILASLILFNFSGTGFSQTENMTFTTYYPAPFGVYSLLRLFPNSDTVKNEDLPCADEGLMYYDGDDNKILYCYYDSLSDTFTWQPLEGTGGHWVLDKDTNPSQPYLYTADLEQVGVDWKVGINKLILPQAKFHVNDGIVLFTGNTGAPPEFPFKQEAGSRLMWIPEYIEDVSEKCAFRAGAVPDSHIDIDPSKNSTSPWNPSKIGPYSFATGYDTQASGYSWQPGSVSMGFSNRSLDSSITFGAHDTGATAIGNQAGATSIGSKAIGYRVKASGRYSTVIGTAGNDLILEATRDYSTAMGFASDTEDPPFGAIGLNELDWNGLAVGDNSKAEGYLSIAIGQRARAPYDRSGVINIENTVYPNFCQADVEGQLKICGELYVTGTIEVGNKLNYGTITAEVCHGNNKLFRIPHPDPSKPEGTFLKHSVIESPTAGDNLYRWTIEVKDGKAIIMLPDYYRFLNKNDMVLVFPKGHFGRAYGKLDEKQETLTVFANSDGEYNVLLIGTRKDQAATKYWQGVEVYEPSG